MSASPVQRDVRALSDFAWQRLRNRLGGITDDEYGWEPAPAVTTIAWRLHHIGSTLAEPRNALWLGLERAPDPFDAGPVPATAAEAFVFLDGAYASWTSVLDAVSDASLSQPIGEVAGPYGDASRLSFALHVLDELVHHAAEVALLRDLYAARSVVP